jgi:phage baseplate assembly protein W
MPIYVGYSSVNINQPRSLTQVGSGQGTGGIVKPFQQPRKCILTDELLVIQDLQNALSIPQGSLPGNPSYGTTLYGFVYEQNLDDTLGAIQVEVTRVIGLDPRLVLNTVNVSSSENGVLIEIQVSVNLFSNPLTASFFLNTTTGTLSQL